MNMDKRDTNLENDKTESSLDNTQSNQDSTSQENDIKKEKRIFNTIITIIVILILLSTLCCCFLNWGKFKKTDTQPQPSLELEEDAAWDGEMTTNNTDQNAMDETITIPGYSALYVDENSKTVRLVNPEENTVYLQYSILKDEDTIYSTKGIKPGNMVEADLYSALKNYGSGEYDLSFVISSYDVDTQESCNGATQTVHITVH